MLKLIPSSRKNYSIPTQKVAADELHKMIEVAAYYLAEKRGFYGDCELHDWLEAENMIRRVYGKDHH